MATAGFTRQGTNTRSTRKTLQYKDLEGLIQENDFIQLKRSSGHLQRARVFAIKKDAKTAKLVWESEGSQMSEKEVKFHNIFNVNFDFYRKKYIKSGFGEAKKYDDCMVRYLNESSVSVIDLVSPARNQLEKKNNSEVRSPMDCSVCFRNMMFMQMAAPKCGHLFCLKCLNEWTLTHKTCPFCKSPCGEIRKIFLP